MHHLSRELLRVGTLAVGVLLSTTTCYQPAVDARENGSWSYVVDAPEPGSRTLTVEATFEGARTERIAIGATSAPFVADLAVRTGHGFRTVERRDGEWFERSCNGRCTLRYRVDLDALAGACGDEVDCARRVGEATLSPSLAWLVHPVPRRDVPVTVLLRGQNAISGMTAADETGRSFAFRSFDLDEGSFTAFGPSRRYRIASPGGDRAARIDVAIVGEQSFAMPDDAMLSWIGEAAAVTVPLFGRFPVEHTTIFVVPARGEEGVTFGKVLSLAGASVVLVVGDRMPAAARHKDWVLVHELFHLGFPTFRGEGRWLGEGLATYYEPVLRARAGWTTDAEVFHQFARNMPRGQPPKPGAGLGARDDLDSIYWGGALFCLAADTRIRAETHGNRSLDDVVRSALARGGDATKVWSVHDVVRLADEATGTTVVSSMVERYAAHGNRIDLEGLLSSLGVEPDGAPDEAKPLAWVRRGILDGSRPEPLVARVAARAPE